MATLQQPAVLIGLVSAIVGLIVKAVRMQTKVDGMAEDLKVQSALLIEVKATVHAHEGNSDVHFNQRIADQVDRRNEQRFVTIEQQLGQINAKLDRLTERE